jgi:hypothetical protein
MIFFCRSSWLSFKGGWLTWRSNSLATAAHAAQLPTGAGAQPMSGTQPMRSTAAEERRRRIACLDDIELSHRNKFHRNKFNTRTAALTAREKQRLHSNLQVLQRLGTDMYFGLVFSHEAQCSRFRCTHV